MAETVPNDCRQAATRAGAKLHQARIRRKGEVFDETRDQLTPSDEPPGAWVSSVALGLLSYALRSSSASMVERLHPSMRPSLSASCPKPVLFERDGCS